MWPLGESDWDKNLKQLGVATRDGEIVRQLMSGA